ncbi:hypothetical protein DUNSADRAFT_2008 [Dunaliella salina]|uniref:EF-hand domain-containing protein n=1 Tax=Dunaliella salina TaxID=3046 RepID=A0ABQ7GWM5_DUNSA|nr:hypothetical protein DUNSADRAFT_2008 [Dunaliella salina]|eukprot:KAF5838917.1 hypothetical protein DUNSADRAFT_2008 [Dunaliella salina]
MLHYRAVAASGTTSARSLSHSPLPSTSQGCSQPPLLLRRTCCRVKPQYYPDAEEDADVLQNAFHAAYEQTKPAALRVPGLQEFAAAIWQRRRAIPSQSYVDPLMHLFQEFDTDNDGVLESEEIASAFQSHGVQISAQQIQELIIAYENGREYVIKREEWPEFVHSLATSDLHVKEHYRADQSSLDEDGL